MSVSASTGKMPAAIRSLVLALSLGSLSACAAEPATFLPAPKFDAMASSDHETAVFAGGCFWGVQAVFEHVKGVIRATSGFAGGKADTAQYERVSMGDTGHAESVKVEFNPHLVSYGELLRIYFSVAHNPTELNYQGPDSGTQYRSQIFFTSYTQQQVAKAYIVQLTQVHAFSDPIVTQLGALQGFYPAEDYHQDYALIHPDNPYIAINDLPKVANLKRLYPADYSSKPVTVMAHPGEMGQ
jgi:peptide-methionine (S)-S-oxide reductase